MERQTGHKPDLFVGKAVETAAEVEGIKKKKAKEQQQKELIAKRRQPVTFRVGDFPMIPETKKKSFFFGVCNVSCHVLVHNICRIQK